MEKFFTCFCLLFTILIAENTVVDSIKIKNPKVAWKLSLIPGVGQIYNERYIKSGLFISAGSYAYVKRSKFASMGKVKKRNTYSWWLFGLYVWGILDSYVDAHLSTFPIDDVNKKSDKEI
jgi:hypothetical protein